MSTHAIPVHVGLIDETRQIPTADLQRAAGALNEQVQADFAPIWHVRATVGIYDEHETGMWAIRVRQTLDEPGALGYHTDAHNQPVSYVELTDDWTVTVSHELLEMLADPWGNRLHQARLPRGLEAHFAEFGLRHESSRVSYLLEVCDPCEAVAYEVGGVRVSDFLTPGWYRTNMGDVHNFSFVNGCRAPREVPDGGYVSFAAGDEWFQAFGDGGRLSIRSLGKFDRSSWGQLRAFTDAKARDLRAAA